MNRRTKVAVAGTAIILVSVSGVAYAYWSTSGTGSGSASTTAGVTNTLSFTTTAISAMYPGDSAQPLVVKVTNTSATQSAYVSGVKAYVTTSNSGCTGADFLINGVAAPSTAGTAVALGWTGQDLTAGGNASTSGDTIQFNDRPALQDACKSATVTVNYVAS